MFSKIILIAGLVALAYSQTPVRECGSGKPAPINVNFNNCTAEPCNVYRGIIGVTKIRFTSPIDTSVVRAELKGTFLGITVNIDLPESQQNGCKLLTDEYCPLEAEITYDYTLSLAPNMDDPLLTAESQFTLYGENDVVLMCYKLKNKVNNP